MAPCWTATLECVQDRPNSFAISEGQGSTWGPAKTTGISGQTMTPVPPGRDRLLALHNRRHGEQAIMMALATFIDESWTVQYEGVLYDANQRRQRPGDTTSGVDELDGFAFGFPTAPRVQDGTLFVTYWSREGDNNGISWTKLTADWSTHWACVGTARQLNRQKHGPALVPLMQAHRLTIPRSQIP